MKNCSSSSRSILRTRAPRVVPDSCPAFRGYTSPISILSILRWDLEVHRKQAQHFRPPSAWRRVGIVNSPATMEFRSPSNYGHGASTWDWVGARIWLASREEGDYSSISARILNWPVSCLHSARSELKARRSLQPSNTLPAMNKKPTAWAGTARLTNEPFANCTFFRLKSPSSRPSRQCNVQLQPPQRQLCL